ncbi:MAG: hypothetical protein HKN01_06725, partial [Acidimicrobiia bacterium]|nr:hypothetical protein [Acidimicrobiia bacterium]
MSESTCIYCGISRERSIPTCPGCDRPWIDATVTAITTVEASAPTPDRPDPAGETAVMAPPHGWGGDAEIDQLTEEFLAQPHPDVLSERRIRPVVIGLGAVLIVLGAIGFILRDPAAEPVALDTTTTAATTTITAATTTTGSVTSTTEAGTTTTAATTTTTSTTLALPDLPVDDLRLGVTAIGETEFGTAGPEAIAALTELMGAPDGVEETTGVHGLCEGETGTVAVWGSLVVVFSDDPELEGDGFDRQSLAGYRLTDGSGHPTEALESVSGLRLTDTLGTMEIIYNRFTVEYPDDDTWVLRGGSGRVL